jgi:NAD(P)H-flavin reductase
MPMMLTVGEIVPVTPRAQLVRLALDGRPFPYQAGQSVLLGTPGERNRRAYSLTDAPDAANSQGYLELLVGSDAAGRMAPSLSCGDSVEIDGPIGTFTFPLNTGDRRFVFIAGGTGIAPLRAMLRQALALPPSEIHLLYSARTPDDFAYADELRDLAVSGRISLRFTVTRTDGAVGWTGGRGRFGRDVFRALVAGGAPQCFVCGPPGMVHDAQRVLQTVGVSQDRIAVEEWCRLQSDAGAATGRFHVSPSSHHPASLSQ